MVTRQPGPEDEAEWVAAGWTGSAAQFAQEAAGEREVADPTETTSEPEQAIPASPPSSATQWAARCRTAPSYGP